MENYYVYINSTVLLLILAMTFLSFKHKGERYLKPFRYIMVLMSIWTACSTLELIFDSYYLKLIVVNITQFAMAFVSVCNYWFVLSYVGLERKIHTFILKIFVLLNTIAMILLFTDPLHHLLRSEVYLGLNNGRLKLIITPTFLGSFFIAIRFILFGYATILLFIFLFKTYKKMRRQVLFILLGYFLALVLLLFEQYLFVYYGTNIPMSTALLLPYAFIGIGIFRYDFLSISPIANEWIIDSLTDGIVILSKDNKIIEKNPSAEQFFKLYESQVDIKKIMMNNNSHEDFFEEIVVETNTDIHYYEFSTHRLLNNNDILIGSVGVIKDTTDQTRLNNELIKRANLDGLTQVYNKEAFEKQFKLIKTNPISLLIIDIDHFKSINDSFGHPVGDIVLLGAVESMKVSIRKQDFIGRIGGDEFCIILNECPHDMCEKITLRILENISSYQYDPQLKLPVVTVSIGALTDIKVDDVSFNEIYIKADEALYEAKEKGRNCMVIKK